jgi:hypothetical protein
VVLLKQAAKDSSLRRMIDRDDLQREHFRQGAVDPLWRKHPRRPWIPFHLAGFVIASPGALPRGQEEQTSALQLQEQRAGGHVFKLSGSIAPVPLLGEMNRQLIASPLRLGCDQFANPIELVGPNGSALNYQCIHARAVLPERAVSSPEQSKAKCCEKQGLVGTSYPALDEPSLRSVWLALLLNTMPETMHQQTENQDPM